MSLLNGKLRKKIKWYVFRKLNITNPKHRKGDVIIRYCTDKPNRRYVASTIPISDDSEEN